MITQGLEVGPPPQPHCTVLWHHSSCCLQQTARMGLGAGVMLPVRERQALQQAKHPQVLPLHLFTKAAVLSVVTIVAGSHGGSLRRQLRSA